MKVESLKQQLQAASGGTFRLAAADLQIAGVELLIAAHFGGTFTVSGAQPNLDELVVEGIGTLDSMQNRPVKVWFFSDDGAVNVTGLRIAYQASGWSINTSFLEFTGDYLKQYAFTSLALVLSACPEDDTVKTYGVGVGVYVNVASKSLFLHACLAPKEQHKQRADVTIRGDFTGLTLADLGLLSGFISGYTFTGLLPNSVPLADEFELRSATFVINPQLEFIVAVSLEVRSGHPWVLVKEKFEFEYLDISFTINTPGESTTVYWNLTSEMKIGNSLEVIAGIDSNLDLLVELAKPVPIKPLLNQYFPAADLDLTVDALRIELAFGDKPANWFLYLAVDSKWTLFDAVAIETIRLSIDGQGASPGDVKANAQVKLGDADLYLGGELNKGAGWDFTGRTTHDYSVQIVPNDAFDPNAPEGSPLKAVPVHNNVSHFMSAISTLFPGRAISGFPAMLDLDINALGVEFNTQTKDFHFNAEIDFGKDVKTALTFSNLHQEGAQSFEKRATGLITVFPEKENEFAFDLGIDLKQESKHFVALYSNTAGKAIKLGDLVKAIYPDCQVQPPDFSITLKDAIVGYVSNKPESQSVFALDMGATVDLTSLGNIPLVGETLSAAKTLKLAFQIIYPAIGNGKIAKADLTALNDLITVVGPKFPADNDLSDLFLKTELRLGDGEPIDFNLPVKINKENGQLEKKDTLTEALFDPSGNQGTDDGVKWFQLNKKFGPVHLQRAGFKFDTQTGEVTALLDGGLTALGLEVDLMALSVTTKVTGVSNFEPKFALEGLGLSFAKGGVEIAGAFLHLRSEYDGLATVQAEALYLAAIGSLTTVENHASLFIYAVLDYPLGGTPAFYITGLAAGFGLNRQLVLPPVDEVSTFPLVEKALNPPTMPTDAGAAGAFITAELQQLDKHLPPSVGQYFGCAGIRFTSFELLDSFVLVSLSFGREFELSLLGISTLVVPPKEPSVPALAVISLQIAASFIPDEGIAIVQGQLTKDSHILDPDCQVTGGFAFAAWFGSNPDAGDFVVSLGGYHPDFQKPGGYPAVPRVGVNWKISPHLGVTGGLYFALTPRALMAGGAMHAIFQIDLDLDIASVEVKAWFILGADFIVYWKPFHYLADAYIDIGIDIVIHFLGTHDIGFDAGADLEVWGSPFGGYAHVSLKIIGITIGFNVDFGPSAPTPPPLDWDNSDASKSFKQSFLPADEQIVSVAIGEGLIRKVDLSNEGLADGGSAQDGEKKGQIWYVINPKDFCVRTSSVVPIKECSTQIAWADDKKALADFGNNTDFGIASMHKEKSKVNTFHEITITRNDKGAESQFVLRPILSNVPGGLWAEENSSDINAKRLIEKAVTGFEIVPAKTPVSGATQPIKRSLLTYTTQVMGDAFAEHSIDTFTTTGPSPGDDPEANREIWDRIQGEIHRNTTRDAVLATMGFAETDLDIGERFTTDAAYAPSYGSLRS